MQYQALFSAQFFCKLFYGAVAHRDDEYSGRWNITQLTCRPGTYFTGQFAGRLLSPAVNTAYRVTFLSEGKRQMSGHIAGTQKNDIRFFAQFTPGVLSACGWPAQYQ